MDLLLQAIEEKLWQTDAEILQWKKYREEHLQASENLREFPKDFRKEIMVPIGAKAIMPGHLYHTNEIYIGMYRGIYVQCSAHNALNLCDHRVNEADKRIEALQAEHRMYRDRLELPARENAFAQPNAAAPNAAEPNATEPNAMEPNADEQNEYREIVEEYIEEDQAKWREEHKIRMREFKQREAQERQQMLRECTIDENAILDNAALMEDLDKELTQMNVSGDEDILQYIDDKEAENVQIPIVENSQPDNSHDDTNEVVDDNDDDDDDDDDDVDDDVDDNDYDECTSKEFNILKKQAEGKSAEEKMKFYDINLFMINGYLKQHQHQVSEMFDEYAEKAFTKGCLEQAILELQETIDAEREQNGDEAGTPQSENPQSLLTPSSTESQSSSPFTSPLSSPLSPLASSPASPQKPAKPLPPLPILTPELFSPKARPFVDTRKFYFPSDFDAVENEYVSQQRSMGELLVFFKCQQRRLMKGEDGSSNCNNLKEEEKRVLYEYISDRIVQIRKAMGMHKQIVVEEDFVDDGDINDCKFKLHKNFGFRMDDGNEKVRFARETMSVFFNKNEAPIEVLKEKERVEDEILIQQAKIDSEFESFDYNNSLGDEQDLNSTNDCDTMNPEEEDCSNVDVNMADDTGTIWLAPQQLVFQFDEHAIEADEAPMDEGDIGIQNVVDPVEVDKQIEFEPSSPPSFGGDALPQVVVPQFDLQELINRAAEQQQELDDDSFTYTVRKMGVPNLNLRPTKSIIKNLSLVEKETHGHVNTSMFEEQASASEEEDESPTEVMGDVVERSEPQENSSSSHQMDIGIDNSDDNTVYDPPVRRTSLFKRSRMP